MVALYVDGSKRVFSTEAETVAEALGRTGTKLGSKDLVEPVGTTRITGDLVTPKSREIVTALLAAPNVSLS